MNRLIPLATPTMHGEEQLYIKEAFDRNWIAPLGFNCDNFEKKLSDYVNENSGKKFHALLLASCTAAIHIAVKLANIGKGDIVLCSDMTFVASVNPVLYEGATPVLIDSERETWNMDPAALEKALEKYPNAKAVILVHLYGTPAKLDEITSICEKHGVVLIEDAAEALSSTYRGRACGTFGKFNTVSFNGNKIITTSSGGVLFAEDEKDLERGLFLATQAKDEAPWYQHSEIGYNYRLSNILAGVGIGQLIHLEEHRALKERIYKAYKEGLKDLPIQINPHLDYTAPNYWLSCIIVNEGSSVKASDIAKKLKENNMESRPLWKPMHMQPLFSETDFIFTGEKPVDEDLFSRGLCLPSDIKMTEEEQQAVIDVIKSCFEG